LFFGTLGTLDTLNTQDTQGTQGTQDTQDTQDTQGTQGTLVTFSAVMETIKHDVKTIIIGFVFLFFVLFELFFFITKR
jgi:hypothetical protein